MEKHLKYIKGVLSREVQGLRTNTVSRLHVQYMHEGIFFLQVWRYNVIVNKEETICLYCRPTVLNRKSTIVTKLDEVGIRTNHDKFNNPWIILTSNFVQQLGWNILCTHWVLIINLARGPHRLTIPIYMHSPSLYLKFIKYLSVSVSVKSISTSMVHVHVCRDAMLFMSYGCFENN